jgi:hypothetical protein
MNGPGGGGVFGTSRRVARAGTSPKRSGPLRLPDWPPSFLTTFGAATPSQSRVSVTDLRSPSLHAVLNTPVDRIRRSLVGELRVPRGFLPCPCSLPHYRAGRRPRRYFRGLLKLHSRPPKYDRWGCLGRHGGKRRDQGGDAASLLGHAQYSRRCLAAQVAALLQDRRRVAARRVALILSGGMSTGVCLRVLAG